MVDQRPPPNRRFVNHGGFGDDVVYKTALSQFHLFLLPS